MNISTFCQILSILEIVPNLVIQPYLTMLFMHINLDYHWMLFTPIYFSEYFYLHSLKINDTALSFLPLMLLLNLSSVQNRYLI